MTLPLPTMNPDQSLCLADRKVFWFLQSSIYPFVLAIIITLIYEVIKYFRAKNTSKHVSSENSKFKKFKSKTKHLVSNQSNSSKYFHLLIILMIGISFIIFLIDSNEKYKFGAEICQIFSDNLISILDLTLNLFFLIYFVIRLILAPNKVWFLFEIYSIVDFMTIPPAFLPIYLDRTWIGFKFLRLVMLWHIPDLLIRFNRVKTSLLLIFIKLITAFIILVLICAGFLFLFENSGDPFDFKNPNPVEYKYTIYYVIFIISTIDGNAQFLRTEYGNGFIVAVIIALIISFLWFLAKIFHRNCLMNTLYYKPFSFDSQKFIIISGNLSKDSLKPILDTFCQKKKKYNDIEVVLMDTEFPELDETANFLLKRVKFFRGSVLNQKDLKDLQAHKADKCILLAKRETKDADSEDATNIMRVISIKTFCRQIPIIVQLIRSQNKYYLNRIPDWNPNKGDKVLCVSELRLRMIGQSCLAPGLNTLLYNLINLKPHKMNKSNSDVERDYINGTKMQIFVQNLSPGFEEMTFSQTTQLCFTKFNITLFAIQTNNNQEIVINPKPDFKLPKQTRAYFIAQDKDLVKRAFWYCLNCHNDITDVKLIAKCKCLRVEDLVKQQYIQEMGFDTEEDKNEEINLLQLTSHTIEKSEDIKDIETNKIKKKNKPKKDKKAKKRKDSTSSTSSNDSEPQILDSDKQIQEKEEFSSECNYDSSASFHYCPKRPIDDCILREDSQLLNGLIDHVIVGIVADKDSPLIGLKNLVLTLRTSNIPSDELKPVLIVGNIDFIGREWFELENIPEVYVFNGSVLCRHHLNAINIIVCNICVILSTNISNKEYKELWDKYTILANINVKTLNFDDSKLQLLALKSKDSSSIEKKLPLKLVRKGSVYHLNIPVITEIQSEDNLKKLSANNHEYNQNINVNQSFASGSVFINTFIDSLTSLSYFKPEIIKLIETLISGGLNTKSETILCETQCLKWKALSSQTLRNRDRCRVTQISLRGPFNKYKQSKYGQLFTEALSSYGILCFGVYRLLTDNQFNTGSDIRYVITNPLNDFQLNSDDLIFAFIQCDTEIQEK